MNDTVRDKNVDEETFLLQMRRDAVEAYKQELVDEIENRISNIEGHDKLAKLDPRTKGIIRGMINCKSFIQSHAIVVR